LLSALSPKRDLALLTSLSALRKRDLGSADFALILSPKRDLGSADFAISGPQPKRDLGSADFAFGPQPKT
jgi:hypothetical protein